MIWGAKFIQALHHDEVGKVVGVFILTDFIFRPLSLPFFHLKTILITFIFKPNFNNFFFLFFLLYLISLFETINRYLGKPRAKLRKWAFSSIFFIVVVVFVENFSKKIIWLGVFFTAYFSRWFILIFSKDLFKIVTSFFLTTSQIPIIKWFLFNLSFLNYLFSVVNSLNNLESIFNFFVHQFPIQVILQLSNLTLLSNNLHFIHDFLLLTHLVFHFSLFSGCR